MAKTYITSINVAFSALVDGGTTLIAAIRQKCSFIGFELDEHYYELTKKRIRIEQSQLTLDF